jgi:hypothetical protein
MSLIPKIFPRQARNETQARIEIFKNSYDGIIYYKDRYGNLIPIFQGEASIYTQDGTLTGDRLLTGANHFLHFKGLSNFTVDTASNINLDPGGEVVVSNNKSISFDNPTGSVTALKVRSSISTYLSFENTGVGTSPTKVRLSGVDGIELYNNSGKTIIENNLAYYSGTGNSIANITADLNPKVIPSREWVNNAISLVPTLYSFNSSLQNNRFVAGAGRTLTFGPGGGALESFTVDTTGATLGAGKALLLTGDLPVTIDSNDEVLISANQGIKLEATNVEAEIKGINTDVLIENVTSGNIYIGSSGVGTGLVQIRKPFKYTGSTPGTGYLLQSNASGDATWQPVSTAAPSLYTGSGTVPTTTVATLTDNLEFAGGNVGIGVAPSGAYALNAGGTKLSALNINSAYSFPTTVAPADNGKALIYDSGSGNLVFQNSSVFTGKTIWVDSVNGNDGTGLRGRQDLPFLTILAAIGAAGITAGDTIMVRPGSYTETGTITIPQGVSLEGQGGYEVTTITGNGTNTVITLSQDSALSDFTITIPNSANYGVEYAGGAGTVAGLRFLKFNGSGNPGSSGIANTGQGKIIGLEIRYGSGDLGNLLLCTDGILACQAIHVPGSGTIQRVAKVTGPSSAGNRGRLQLLDLNVGNPNVEYAVEIGNDAVAVLISLNLFNIKNGLLISGNTAQTDALGGKIQTSSTITPASYPASLVGVQGFAVVVAPGLNLASAKTKIDALLEPNFLWDQTVTPNAAASEFSVTLTQSGSGTRNAALRTFGSEIINGFPEKGSGLSTGEGGANATFNRVFQLNTAGNYLADITTDAADNTASTFTWGLAAAPANDNQSICFCTTRRDVNNNLLKHWGLIMDVATNGVKAGPASPADADYIFEIYTGAATYNPASWTSIGAMSTSEEEQYRYANNHFLRANNVEEIRFGIDNTTTWNTTTINSVEGYYARIRVRTNTTSTYPTFNQLKITPSFVQFNDKGQQQFHGLSQYRKTLFGAGNTWGLGNGVTDTSVDVASTSWTQDNTNSRANGTGDYITFQFAVPGGLSTAHPVKFKVIYSTTAGSALTNIGMNLRVAPQEIVGNLVADPAGGIVPTARTEPNTTGYNSIAPQLVNFPDASIYPEKLRVQEFDGYDISSYYEDDLLIIQLELLDGVTGPTLNNARPFDLWAIVIEGVSFTNGINL